MYETEKKVCVLKHGEVKAFSERAITLTSVYLPLSSPLLISSLTMKLGVKK